jgi:uncharacterized protein (TIGR02217 family)
VGAFLEERIDTAIRIGFAAEDSYALVPSTTQGGARYVWLVNGKPYREFDISYIKARTKLFEEVSSLYHRTYGGYAGFRVRSNDDFSTANDGISAYTATDCILDEIGAGLYQLVKEYGRGKPGLPGIGRPRRTLFKPVQGQWAIAVAGQELPDTQYSVDSTTGQVQMAANKSRAITGISQAAQAVLTVGANTFAVGESVVISDVSGMTQINELRALITARTTTTITVDINSSAFSAYVSGGTVQTNPIAGEVVTGGCEFDIPCAFDSRFSIEAFSQDHREVAGLRLIELLDP